MNDLTLICETCQFPIAGDTGSIYVRFAEIGTGRDGSDIHWRTGHDKCRTDRDEGCYEIDGDRIATWPALAHWTAHLMEKNWFGDSDWDGLLRELAGDSSPRRIRAAAREAA